MFSKSSAYDNEFFYSKLRKIIFSCRSRVQCSISARQTDLPVLTIKSCSKVVYTFRLVSVCCRWLLLIWNVLSDFFAIHLDYVSNKIIESLGANFNLYFVGKCVCARVFVCQGLFALGSTREGVFELLILLVLFSIQINLPKVFLSLSLSFFS